MLCIRLSLFLPYTSKYLGKAEAADAGVVVVVAAAGVSVELRRGT
jgi:hypothetical protein